MWKSWLVAGCVAAAAFGTAVCAAPQVTRDRVVVDLSRPVNTFTPNEALGAALDGMEKDEVKLYLTPFNIEKMHSSGVRRVTYRTRPELGIKLWHWTEEGTWSDPEHKQGYWTGSDHPSKEPDVTWGYDLPRRGDSIDNASNVGYSRIDDGDPASFWKSNPYLDHRYTGLAETRPAWIVLSFEKAMPIDAASIQWAAPWAKHFLVQYWDGEDGYWEGKEVGSDKGHWRTFPHGDVTVEGVPGDKVLHLADKPMAVHFVRILMLESSETGPEGSTDIRDRLGYAVREVGVGSIGRDGKFTDVVRHGKTKETQTVVQVSSTDPWHRAVDRDLGTEQPSLDFVFRSGLSGGLPLMVPVGVYYDTPENALAEIRYVKSRGWPVSQIELGEEPDGQFIRPEDYADLYVVWARKIHEIDPTLQLGGPSMQGALTGTWPDTESGTAWMGRFVAELKARGGLDQFQFYSFEHYAFDDVCGAIDVKLRQEDVLLDNIITQNTQAGVPTSIPWVISEYGLSPFSGRQMSDIGGALYAADVVGHFLTKGGAAAYMFGYTPDEPINQNFPCAGFGNMMLYQADDSGRSKWPMAMYWAERMMLKDWATPNDKPQQLYAAHSSVKDKQGRPYLVAYPLKGPDGHWAVMLVNRDPDHAHAVDLSARGAGFFAVGKLSVVQFSPAQYRWLTKGDKSHPSRDEPPVRSTVKAGAPIRVPPMSLTVVRGDGPKL